MKSIKMAKGKLLTILTALIIASSVSIVKAEEEAPSLGVTLDATYASQYIWRGYDLFDNDGAFQPSVDFDLFGSGFSANVWSSIPLGSGSEDFTEADYTLAYGTTLFEEEVYAVDFGVNYIYYDFPKAGSKDVPDSQEVGAGIALPNLLPLGDSALVPSYYAGYLYGYGDIEGYYHSFALSYDIAVGEQTLSLYGDVNYNDQLFGGDSSWTHSTVGVSTSFECGPVSISPAVNYQISFDDSINDENEFWASLSVSYSF